MQTAVVAVVALLLPLSALLRLGCLATATAAADTNRTSSGNDTSCAPARCGGLNITYPFSLAGVHPLECGYPDLGLTCDDAAAGRAYLSRTFRVNLYRVLSISYDNRSMLVAVETAFSGYGACRIPDFNVSSGLGLFPVNVSATNRDDLNFVYNCKIPRNELLTGPCAKHAVGAYISERPGDVESSRPQWVQANCSSASVPVRGFQDGMNLTRESVYESLISDGFLLDWPTLGDCDACKLKGGQCRFFELSFQCVNSSTSSRGGTNCRRDSAGRERGGGEAAVQEQLQERAAVPERGGDPVAAAPPEPGDALRLHLAAQQPRPAPRLRTASALEYLHGVEPHQVVHRDVKTNNILLDEAFHVKVADFGLSRLFPAHATHVSTAPQGTPGYVDPMYHQCYQLTDKSDVYSFGVVLVELISSRPAVDMSRARAGGGGDVNLASMAVHMIQCDEIDRLVDPRIGYRTDGGTKRAVDLVAEMAFRCLQPEQDVRPPIGEVLDALREAQRVEQDGCAVKAKDDMGLLKKSRDGSPDSVMYQWTSPSTTTHNSS
ncbi:unnamed protein product [Miscanthus lutarioriparius]|uniref:Protein kinase domain-containing protein n=1 Tax=Miscanthus lutarioriparius TaxID=422564 RepID=A0A811P2W2_9POAL|nr:unnamed protein product [Miscanthus lutarioriparius]